MTPIEILDALPDSLVSEAEEYQIIVALLGGDTPGFQKIAGRIAARAPTSVAKMCKHWATMDAEVYTG